MAWTYEEIESDWLLDGRLAASSNDIVAAFDDVERVLGRDWIEASRTTDGTVFRGINPTLHIVSIGQRLAAIEQLAGSGTLIEKLRKSDDSAFAELSAIHLVRGNDCAVEVELEPPVQIGTQIRNADFRCRLPAQPWTYVEVTQPNISADRQRVTAILARLVDPLKDFEKSFSLEVFLRRQPSDQEVDELLFQIRQLCAQDGVQSEDLPGLAKLSLNLDSPGSVNFHDHRGEESQPRLGRVEFMRGGGISRHICVRMPYADDRAEEFLRRKARQLSVDAPGLIMVQTGKACGGFRTWGPTINRRFQPAVHTRVSAVCLFESSHEDTAVGEDWIHRAKLILNPHANQSLPAWLAHRLNQFRTEHKGASVAPPR